MFGDMSWRPRLRQIGWAPEGEDWRCWLPVHNTAAGEGHWETIELSLLERWRTFIGYRDDRHIARVLKGVDIYTIVHLDEPFQAVLHLPKPLAELLDDDQIPRTRQVWHFEHMFGPPPQMYGPQEQSGLLPHGTLMGNDKELLVQPMFRHIAMLPIFKMPSLESWKKTGELLAQHEHKKL